MGVAIALKRGERCPICGKTDFCYRLPIPADLIPDEWCGEAYYSVCNRTGAGGTGSGNIRTVGLAVSVGDNVEGLNGITYTCNKVYPDSVSVRFEPAELRALRKAAWKAGKTVTRTREVSYATEDENVENPPECDARLDKVYRTFLSLLKLEPEHRNYLLSEGISDGLIRKWMIVSVPESDFYRYQMGRAYATVNERRKETCRKLVAAVGELDGVPGFKKNKDGSWTYSGYGGILFPLLNPRGQVHALRLRVNCRWHDKEGFPISEEKYKSDPEHCSQTGKYVNFTTWGKDGCKIGCRPGVFIPRIPKGETLDTSTVWCTEGEKKSIVGGEYLRSIFIDVPGVSSYRLLSRKDEEGFSLLDRLWNNGVQNIVIAYDADKETNRMVLNAEAGFVNMLNEKGFRVYVADWDINIGKGIDDLLRNGGVPTVTPVAMC